MINHKGVNYPYTVEDNGDIVNRYGNKMTQRDTETRLQVSLYSGERYHVFSVAKLLAKKKGITGAYEFADGDYHNCSAENIVKRETKRDHVFRLWNKGNITKSEIGRLVGVSRQYVSKVLK